MSQQLSFQPSAPRGRIESERCVQGWRIFISCRLRASADQVSTTEKYEIVQLIFWRGTEGFLATSWLGWRWCFLHGPGPSPHVQYVHPWKFQQPWNDCETHREGERAKNTQWPAKAAFWHNSFWLFATISRCLSPHLALEHKGAFEGWRYCRLLDVPPPAGCFNHKHTRIDTQAHTLKAPPRRRRSSFGCFQRRCIRETAGKVWVGKNMWPLTWKEVIYTGL